LLINELLSILYLIDFITGSRKFLGRYVIAGRVLGRYIIAGRVKPNSGCQNPAAANDKLLRQEKVRTLTNSEGKWFLTSPSSVQVHKTKNDFSVECTKDGYQPGNQIAVSKFGGATFGNIVLGGGVGAIVDAASGANYYYDSRLTVPLGEPKGAVQAPAPDKATPGV
jgi:hypothetical protein